MKILYSSHGDASVLYSLFETENVSSECAAKIADMLAEAKEDPRSVAVTELDRRDIKELVTRCEPQYFLFLRELSVFMRAHYAKLTEKLLSVGFLPVKRALFRFAENTRPEEMLAAGICAGVCGVGEVVFSVERATLTPKAACACRLAGIGKILLCDEISAVSYAVSVFGTDNSFDTVIGKGSEKFRTAAALASSSVPSKTYPCFDTSLFALFDGGSINALLADLECELEKGRSPIVICASDEAASAISEKFPSENNGTILSTSSDAETQKILEKSGFRHANIYGNVSETTIGFRSDKFSPLMASSSAPTSIYPYSPEQLMRFSPDVPEANVVSFAGAVAKFVGKDVLPECEVAAIGERLADAEKR